MIKLVDRMYCSLENLYGRKHFTVVSDNNKVKNKWCYDKEVVFQSPSANKAAKELE